MEKAALRSWAGPVIYSARSLLLPCPIRAVCGMACGGDGE
jgi:hypothetical protein